MSKHMDDADIELAIKGFNHPSIALATKATLLTAWLMLKNTPEEATGLTTIKHNYSSLLPPELHF